MQSMTNSMQAGSEEHQNPDIAPPLADDATNASGGGDQASSDVDRDASEQQGEAETSSSSWGSDAEEETAGDHNSLWTLEFQAAEDGTSDILEDTAIFQSSADFSHDSTVEAPSAEQSGAGEPDWVKPWSSPNTQSSKLKENCVQQSKADQASQQTPRSKFQSEPLSEEHKTAIIGAMKNVKLNYVPRWAMSLSDDKWLDKLSNRARAGEVAKRKA